MCSDRVHQRSTHGPVGLIRPDCPAFPSMSDWPLPEHFLGPDLPPREGIIDYCPGRGPPRQFQDPTQFEVDQAMAATVITTRQSRTHSAAAVLAGSYIYNQYVVRTLTAPALVKVEREVTWCL